MSSDNIYFEVATMGDFQVGRRKIRTRKVRPLDTGCFWFRDCEACRWEGCVTHSIARYDSAQARALRGEAFKLMLGDGLPLPKLAEFFGVEEREVLETAGVSGRFSGHRFDESSREDAKAEAVRMCESGMVTTAVAKTIGVSVRTVISWCGHGPGHNAGASNRARKQEAMTVPMPNNLQERVEALRAIFK